MIKSVVRKLCVLMWCFMFCPNFVKSQTNLQNIIPESQQRYLCTALLNVSEGDEWGLDYIKQTAELGCNSVMVTIRWDVVYYTPNSTPNWTQYDNQVKLAKSLGMKIFFRFHLGRCCKRHEGFWTLDEAMKDERGRVISSIFSMAHQPSLDKATAFVKEASQRYLSYQKSGDVICTAVTVTPTQEAGFHYDESDGTNTYLTVYDYSTPTIAGYRKWLIAKYKTEKELNKAWGSDYNLFSDVYPIMIDQVSTENKRYIDWYLYRHYMLKNFLDTMSKSIKEVDGTYKVVNDFGSTWDGLSSRRVTFAFKDLAKNTDGTKVNDSSTFPEYFSADLLRSNTPDGKWIMNEAFPEPNMQLYEMRNMLEAHFKGGCKLVNVVIGSQEQLDWFAPNIKYVAENILTKPMTPIATVGTVTAKLSELVRTGGYSVPGYMAQWNELQKKGRVNIRLVEDLLGEKEQNQLPVLQNSLIDYTLTAGFEVSYPIIPTTFIDPDGEVKSYEVSGLPQGLSWQNGTIKGTSKQVGTYKITVKAIDNDGGMSTTTFSIILKAPKQVRIDIYKAGTSQLRSLIRTLNTTDSININNYTYPLNFFATPSDISTKAVKMILKGPVNKEIIETDAPFALFGDNGGSSLTVGNYQLTVETYNSTTIAAINGLSSSTYSFRVSNYQPNIAPVVANTIANQQIKLNNAYTFTVPLSTFSDKDGKITGIKITGLPEGLTAIDNQISGIPSKIGNSTIIVEATDDRNAKVQTQFIISVSAVNLPPVVLEKIPNQFVTVGNPYNYAVPLYIFKDPDGYISKIAVATLPAGLSYSNGRIVGTPMSTGIYTIAIKVFDNEGLSVETSYQLYIKNTNSNFSPIVSNNIPNQEAIVGQTYKYQILNYTFTDPEGESIRVEIQGLPLGLYLNNGAIDGKPEIGGTFNITVRGYDPAGNFAETSFQMSVKFTNGNMPPVIQNHISDQTATVGEIFKFEIPITTFADPDGVITSILLRGNLPNGLTYKNGVISGIPLTVGNFTLTVRALDNEGAIVEDYFIIKVGLPTTTVNFSLFQAGGASSRKFVKTINQQDRIGVSYLPSVVNIFAESKTSTDKVQFDLTGPVNYSFTDTSVPYGLYGDNDGFRPKVGTYKLSVMLFKNNQVISRNTVDFEFYDDAAGGGKQPESNLTWNAAPNPFYESFIVTLPTEYDANNTKFTLIDLLGHQIAPTSIEWQDRKVLLSVSNLHLNKGTYLLQIKHAYLAPKAIKVIRGE